MLLSQRPLQALAQLANSLGYDFEIVKAVIRVNQRQRRRMVEKILRVAGPVKERPWASWDSPSNKCRRETSGEASLYYPKITGPGGADQGL